VTKLLAFLLGLFGFVVACCGMVASGDAERTPVLITAVGVGLLGSSVLISWFDQEADQ
jgi:hypothetical protein